jgi:hypothetical protein
LPIQEKTCSVDSQINCRPKMQVVFSKLTTKFMVKRLKVLSFPYVNHERY